MKFQIPASYLDRKALEELFKKAEDMIKKKVGTIPLTEFLSMLPLSEKARNNIKIKRGALRYSCTGNACTAENKGKEVEAAILGTKYGIVINKVFKCKFVADTKVKILVIDKIKGLDAEVPGPNWGVDKITIRLEPLQVNMEV